MLLLVLLLSPIFSTQELFASLGARSKHIAFLNLVLRYKMLESGVRFAKPQTRESLFFKCPLILDALPEGKL